MLIFFIYFYLNDWKLNIKKIAEENSRWSQKFRFVCYQIFARKNRPFSKSCWGVKFWPSLRPFVFICPEGLRECIFQITHSIQQIRITNLHDKFESNLEETSVKKWQSCHIRKHLNFHKIDCTNSFLFLEKKKFFFKLILNFI